MATKKMILAADVRYQNADKKAQKILKPAQALLDEMDSADTELLENNDLMPLYDELIDVIPALSFAINSKSLDV